jgi:hypothetical protein
MYTNAKKIFNDISNIILNNKSRQGETFSNLLKLIKQTNPSYNYNSRDLSRGINFGIKNNYLQKKNKFYKLINKNNSKGYLSPKPIINTYYNDYLNTLMDYLLTSKNLCSLLENIESFLRIRYRNLSLLDIRRTLNLGIKKNLIVEIKKNYQTYYHVEWGVKYCGYKTKPCGIIIQGPKKIMSLLSTLVNKILINRYLNYRNIALTELKRKIDTIRSYMDIKNIILRWIYENNNFFSIIEQGISFSVPVSQKPHEIYEIVNENVELFNHLKIRSESEIYFLKDIKIDNFDFDECEANIRISGLVNESYTRFYNNKVEYNEDTHYLLGITPPNIKSRLLTNYGAFIDVGLFSGKMEHNETGVQSAIRELLEESGIKLSESFVRNNQIDGFKNIFVIELKNTHTISTNMIDGYITIS